MKLIKFCFAVCLAMHFARPLLCSEQETKERKTSTAQQEINQLLKRAVEQISPNEVYRLIKLAADVNTKTKNRKGYESPLIIYAISIHKLYESKKSYAMVMHLLNAIPTLNVRDNDTTPLLLAVNSSDYPLVYFMLNAGADVNFPNEHGVTPLMEAKEKAMIDILLAHGANVNATDSAGDSVLHILLTNVTKDNEQKYEGLLKLLLDAGANIDQKNFFGLSAYERSQQEHVPERIKKLFNRYIKKEIHKAAKQTKGQAGDLSSIVAKYLVGEKPKKSKAVEEEEEVE